MRRREFTRLLGGAAATWPLAARAQQQKMPVIGVLSSEPLQESEVIRLLPFRQGLSETAYVEGRNVTIVYRSAEGQNDRLPKLASELVSRQVDVIAAIGGLRPVFAAKAATATVPVVFFSSADPVALGLVASLNRPGGNLTGVVTLGAELGLKRLEFLHEIVPEAKTYGFLVNPGNPIAARMVQDAKAAAGKLGLAINVLSANSTEALTTAFEKLHDLRVDALLIAPDPLFNDESAEIAAFAERHAIPAIYQYRQFAAAGGLMSYGSDIKDSYRLVGIYVGRILKGEKPAELPVQQSTKVELIINLKAAKALGLNVPLPLLGRADEVIE